MKNDLETTPFIFLDCETTGLDLEKDRVIEVAILLATFTEVLDSFETLIDPGIPIPESSTKIHHITDDMVRGKPTAREVLPDLFKRIKGNIIVGHGIEFDIEMLFREAERGSVLTTIRQNPSINTLRLARLYGESPTNSLETLRCHFNIPDEGAHRAMNDIVVNREVFRFLSRNFRSKKELFSTLERPILMKTMPLGKHKGRPIRDLPQDYLSWAARKDFDQDLLFSLRHELQRRKKGGLFTQASNPFQDLSF